MMSKTLILKTGTIKHRSDTKISRDDSRWLAGLLEGEGCFCSSHLRNGVKSNGCFVYLKMADKDVVEKAAKIIRANIKPRNPSKPGLKSLWEISVHGDAAVSTMKAILPFMGARRTEKIKYLLDRASRRMSRSEAGRKGALSEKRKK